MAFIDDHRDVYGVESICECCRSPRRPTTSISRKRRSRKGAGSGATRQELRGKIRRVWEENFQVYGVGKVWRQLEREGEDVARCTVERLMERWVLRASSEEDA